MTTPQKTIPQKRLPETRSAINHEFNIGGHEGLLSVGLFEDGCPGELFIVMAKEGPTIGGLLDAISTLTSIALQNGVSIEVLSWRLSGYGYEPSGDTNDPNLAYAKSITDYVFRWLEHKFVTGSKKNDEPGRTTIETEGPTTVDRQPECPVCPDCGHQTTVNGLVFVCLNCGRTVGNG